MKRHFSRFLFFLVFLGAALLTSWLGIRSSQPEQAGKRFQYKIQEQEQKADDIVEILSDSGFMASSLFGSAIEKDLSHCGFHMFQYHKEILTYWSDSQIPISQELFLELHGDSIIKTGNSWNLLKYYQIHGNRTIILIPVKSQYNYENQYLSNEYQSCYQIGKETELIFNRESGIPIFSEKGDYLVSLLFSGDEYISSHWITLLVFFYLLALVFLILFLLELYRNFKILESFKLVKIILFTLDVVIIRLILGYFHFPDLLFSSAIFDPSFFAHSSWLPSLGDMLINAVLLVLVAYAWYSDLHFIERKNRISRPWYIFIAILLFASNIFILYYTNVLISSLVINSTLSFDLTSLLGLNFFSIVGFFIISLLLLAGYFLSTAIIRYVDTCLTNRSLIFGVFVLSVAVITLALSILASNISFLSLVLAVLFMLFCLVIFIYKSDKLSLGIAVLIVAVFSIIASLILDGATREKEKSNMKLLALSISNQRDRVAEYLFDESANSMMKDSTILILAQNCVYNDEEESVLDEYIRSKYLSGYWKQFDYQFTVCDDQVDLSLGNDGTVMNCQNYFSDLIGTFGERTYGESLFFINDNSGMASYLGDIVLNNSEILDRPIHLYIDIIPKYVREGLGYPELMIDDQFRPKYNFSDYSWAIFIKGSLVRNLGNYFYSSKLSRYQQEQGADLFFKHNQWNHFLYHAGKEMVIVVSSPKRSFIDTVAPFSYLILFFGLLYIGFFIIFLLSRREKVHPFSTRNRLQVSMTGFLFVALTVVGFSSVRYILVLNSDKNREALQEKAHSVLTELEHKLSGEERFDDELYDYLTVLFTKWSNVFFSDINLYSPDGSLLVSSRPEIFDENLTSRRMDAAAYKALALDRKMQFIGEEKIGKYVYLSAWVQFRNESNELVAYLNLPFFARQSELSNKVSGFLMTFINIYVLLIVIALLIGLLLSNIISKPLERIREKIALLSLGRDNEKLEWLRDDEIGALVKEYNAKVDELARNTALLAQTERETAWREMARQVAHEIKNPLTPMKLSIQHLKRAWDDKAPDWDQRLKRFTDTMVEQIDSMAEIATAFSDFAKMPKAQLEVIDLNILIHNSVDLFKSNPDVDIHLELSSLPMPVYADPKQLLRVFNNLLKNSFQALDGLPGGTIRIRTWVEEGTLMVCFSDNGPGIPSMQADKIFVPNFTTKSGGMGLGLAMVKNIVLNSGGQIWFESEKNQDTVFYISLPMFT